MPRTGSGKSQGFCLVCGAIFESWPSWHQKCCSTECANVRLRRLYQEKYKAQPHPMLGLKQNPEWVTKRVQSSKGRCGAPKGSPGFRGHHTEATKDRLRQARMSRRFPRSHTRIELRFEAICERYHLPFKYVGDGQLWIENLNPDFIHLTKPVAIEVFGDYWHRPGINPIHTESKRREILSRNGWQLCVFWGSELVQPNAENTVLERLGAY